MKYIKELSIMGIIGCASLIMWHTLDAQDTRTGTVNTNTTETTVNTNTTTNNAVRTENTNTLDTTTTVKTERNVQESIESVTRSVEQVEQEKVRAMTEIQDAVKEDIDSNIIEIRRQTQKPTYELQQAIDTERTDLFETVNNTVNTMRVTDSEEARNLETRVVDSIGRIRTTLQNESTIPVDFQRSERNVRNTILRLQHVLEEKERIITEREGNLVFQDSDSDGVSDYDEIYIYGTDPKRERTREGGETDGEKIRRGINPLSDEDEIIQYQDPRDDRESYVSAEYRVQKVQLMTETRERQAVMFEGTALPNSFITLYVFSTPIIVTVKTDDMGKWTYELDQELENGEHQIYVASVDSSGKIIARSNPIIFTKTAEAAAIGIMGSTDTTTQAQNFFKDNLILIALSILIVVVVLTMMITGRHANVRSALEELRNEVNQK